MVTVTIFYFMLLLKNKTQICIIFANLRFIFIYLLKIVLTNIKKGHIIINVGGKTDVD